MKPSRTGITSLTQLAEYYTRHRHFGEKNLVETVSACSAITCLCPCDVRLSVFSLNYSNVIHTGDFFLSFSLFSLVFNQRRVLFTAELSPAE